jgi:large subunit ribosomal protein L15
MSDETPLTLHTLKPAEGSHRERKRVGRGHGSGNGKTAGRGHKGQKSRSGSHNMRAGFEGGQMPLYMRLGKLPGPNHRMSMPMGPFRTHTTPVNVRSLDAFDAGTEVTPELLKAAGVVRTLRHPVKILGTGELKTKLTVHAHAFSKRAVEVIEGAGGTVVVIGRAAEAEAQAKPAKAKPKPKAAAEPEPEAAADEPEAEAAAEPEPADEPEAAEPEAEEAPAEEPVADDTDETPAEDDASADE